ncbi:hydrolase YugF [Acrasis kona]|uniref:Hydrolase YugF n=1 Tax=Acrasis kona TaxID=1008807 RepID=A0AAW2Z990_9EUKA
MECTVELDDKRKLGYKNFGPSSLDEAAHIVFYLSGTPSTRNYLSKRQMEQLSSKSDTCLLVIERPGFGISDSKQRRTLLDYADDVQLLYTKVVPHGKKISLIGYSGGGPFALACAFKIPEILNNVVVVCSLGPRSDKNSTTGMYWFNKVGYFIAYQSSWLIEKAVGMDVATFLANPKKKVLDDYKHNKADHDYLVNNDDVLEMFAMSTKECYEKNQHVTEAWEYHLFASDWGFNLEEINVPVQVFYGEKDTACTPSMSICIASKIKKSSIHCINDQAHMVFFDQFERILQTTKDTSI